MIWYFLTVVLTVIELNLEAFCENVPRTSEYCFVHTFEHTNTPTHTLKARERACKLDREREREREHQADFREERNNFQYKYLKSYTFL